MSDVEDAFGRVAAAMPGYKQRPGQLEYAEAVASCIDRGGRLLVEGPTGVGKSLGYLVPAILSGKKVLVVTEGIALQDQLMDKDLPLLAKALEPFTFKLLKGRSNYLCLRQRAKMDTVFATTGGTTEEGVIATWSRMTATGDRKELPVAPSGPAWGKFSVSAEECLGTDCDEALGCFALRAAAEARTAQVLVVNYHLLYLNAVITAATDGNSQILPEHDVLVLDEAHAAASIARDVFGFDLSGHALRRIVDLLEKEGKTEKLVQSLRDASADFFSGLLAYKRAGKKDEERRRIRDVDLVPWMQLSSALRDAAAVLEARARHLVDVDRAKARQARNAGNAARRHSANVTYAMRLSAPDPTVFFVEEKKGAAVLCGRLIDVSKRVGAVLDKAASVVVTSATLAAAGDFSLVADDLGVGEHEELVVESPFDMRKQMAVVLPEVPVPTVREYRGAADEAIAQAVRGAGGRTLVLCTSNAGVKSAAEALDGCGFRVLRQGEMSTAMLVEEFRCDVKSVLVGTMSLWRGVDVSGEALSCVVIDKLPFEVRTDPIVEALYEHDGGEGWPRYLARAVVQFRQGVGRLIRSETDRGVVVVLDGRLHSKGYAAKFLKCFAKGTSLSTDVGYVGVFLGGAT